MGSVFKVIRFVLGLSRDSSNAGRIMFLVVFTGMISGVANTGMIVVINGALTGDDLLSAIPVGWAFAGLCLGLPFFRFISQTALVHLTQRMLYGLRLNWCRRILALPLRQLEKLGPPRLLASLTNDLGAITDALALLPLIFMHLAILSGCLVYLGWLSWKLLLGLLGFMVVGILSYQLPLLRAIGYQRIARQQWDKLLRHIQGVTHGSKELKMHQPRRQALIDQRLEPTADSLRGSITTATTIFAAASSWGQSLFFVAIGLLLFVVPGQMPVGQEVLVGYCLTLIHMMTPLETILTSLPRLTNASVAINTIREIGLSLEETPAEPDAKLLPSGEADWQRLELKEVLHTYRGKVEKDTFELGPINLTIEPGELTFIVGGNGSGKTTLAKLLLGLYPPHEGEIWFDGEPVTDENRDRYRQHFSTVFSDFFLFDALLGLDSPDLDESARKYLRELQLEHKVTVEDGSLSTTDLSQGQRKRLALLTAYMEDRPIYLFDEWAADQDPYFKEIFYRQLLPELKARGKTVLVISHDDRYYDAADRILKLEFGKLKFDQRRDELVIEAGSGVVHPKESEA